MKHGITPLMLASQGVSTAAWALEESHGEPVTLAARTTRDAARIDEAWQVARGDLEYLRLLLSAPYLTAALREARAEVGAPVSVSRAP